MKEEPYPRCILTHVFKLCCFGAVIFIMGAAQSGLATVPDTQPATQPEMDPKEKDLRLQLKHLGEQPVTAETTEKLKALQVQLLNHVALQLNSGKLALRGDVVDEDGNPINGVTLYVTRRVVLRFGETKGVTEERQIDSAFNVTVSGGISASISFVKAGFHSEALSLQLSGRDAAEMLMPYTGTDGRVKIVLEKKEKPTRLDNYSIQFASSTDTSTVAADVTSLVEGNAPAIIRLSAGDQKKLPAIALYVTADLGGSGGDATVIAQASLPRRPAKLQLRLEGKNSGLVKRVLRTGVGKSAAARMRKAPDAGYQSDIQFVAEELVTRQWFYCHVGGKYGRGVIRVDEIVPNAKEVKVRIELYMQPDGSRNLDTGE